MINLYLQYFSHKDNIRRQEIDFCTKHNINNKVFDKVYVLLEKEEDDLEWLHNERTEVHNLAKRASYKDFVEYANEKDTGDDIHILVNSDIFFDNSVKELEQMGQKDFVTLTRWDINAKTKQAKFFNVNCSQDTWIWRGEVDFENTELDLTYYLGTPGCDNAVCGEFHENGYKVLNPSLKVKTYHLHQATERDYSDADVVRKKLYLLYPTDNFNESKIQYWKDCTNFKPV